MKLVELLNYCTGTALRDTPVGLAAYILEKFSTWTNPAFRSLPDGGLTKKYSLDALLDNVMIYWTTGSITTSQRLYTEYFCDVTFTLDMYVQVPIIIVCLKSNKDNKNFFFPLQDSH